MENGRMILAIALSFLVFLVWNVFFEDNEATEKKQAQEQGIQTEKQAGPTSEKITGLEPTAEMRTAGEGVESNQETFKEITVSTPLYTVRISEKGAAFKSFRLKNYRESMKKNSDLKQLISPENISGNLLIKTATENQGKLDEVFYKASVETDTIEVGNAPETLSFSWISPTGIIFEKKFHFEPESYQIGLDVTVKNGSKNTFNDNLIVSLEKQHAAKKATYGFQGPSGWINNKLEQIKIKKIKEQNEYKGEIGWIALQDRYFITSLIPKTGLDATMRLFEKENNIIENQYVEPVTSFDAGTQRTFKYNVFLGPKSMKILKTVPNKLVGAVNFGMFDILAKPCLWLMNFIHDNLIPNYGIAIILLTMLTKLILWPLGSKSYKSMAEMKKIQPLMAEIKEKYKNDKKKMNEETMALYRTYKVNPMGGCLPMVVQIPVFFALYRMLYEAIELRHAPFFGWINDLSAPDRLLNFNFTIPFMQPPYGIPVLTIIMGATMLLQQKMSPPMGDATQAKMMMLMPIVFTFIFINFSSGLVLYWLVNNVLSISQQYYIQKKNV